MGSTFSSNFAKNPAIIGVSLASATLLISAPFIYRAFGGTGGTGGGEETQPFLDSDRQVYFNLDQPRSYSKLPEQLIDYISKTGYSVTEVCAGNGDNAELLRQQNVVVHAYDLNSIKGKVQYGINGLVENNNDDNILLISLGFDCERSINNFKGNILILGGYLHPRDGAGDDREYVTSLADPVPFVVEKYNQLYSLELRPSFSRVREMGWNYSTSFFGSLPNHSTIYAYYVFIRTNDSSIAGSSSEGGYP